MKQLLFIIITFLFVSNVYADDDSSAYILGNGKVIYSHKDNPKSQISTVFHIVYYKKQVFRCITSYNFIECILLKDNPINRRAVEQ